MDLVEAACEVMHDAYENAAVGAGWETNPASRKPWSDVPEANKETMRKAVGVLIAWLDGRLATHPYAFEVVMDASPSLDVPTRYLLGNEQPQPGPEQENGND